jgi:hypothetical protein
MSELVTELRAIGRAINHAEYIDAGVVPLTLAHAANHIEALESALRDANARIARIDSLSEDLIRKKREENNDVFPGFRGNNEA